MWRRLLLLSVILFACSLGLHSQQSDLSSMSKEDLINSLNNISLQCSNLEISLQSTDLLIQSSKKTIAILQGQINALTKSQTSDKQSLTDLQTQLAKQQADLETQTDLYNKTKASFDSLKLQSTSLETRLEALELSNKLSKPVIIGEAVVILGFVTKDFIWPSLKKILVK